MTTCSELGSAFAPDLTATALVVDDGKNRSALVAVDLMYIDAEFVQAVRQLAAAETDLLVPCFSLAGHGNECHTGDVLFADASVRLLLDDEQALGTKIFSSRTNWDHQPAPRS